MREYENKILRGGIIQGAQLRLPRAIDIYIAATNHIYSEVIQCKRNHDNDEIIIIKLFRLEIPENPIYDIRTEETIAVVCKRVDKSWPEVYALRKDFPLGLAHSIPKPFKRPVSLCVIDFDFIDVRLQFSAYEYINTIRDWLEKNSVDEVHAKDRPLEIFIAADRIFTINREADSKQYPGVVYKNVTDKTMVLKTTDNEPPTHCPILVFMEPSISTNIVYEPQNLGELSELIMAQNKEPLLTYIVRMCDSIRIDCRALPILILLLTKQKRTENDSTQETGYIVSLNVSAHDILHNKSRFSQEQFDNWLRAIHIRVDANIPSLGITWNRLSNATVPYFSHIAIIGAGTLGANVIDHLWRKGVSEKLTIIDYDVYSPHNYGRHVLPTESILQYKAQAICDKFKGVLGQEIVPVIKNALELTEAEERRVYKEADLVIDASTIIAVERHLARDFSAASCRCCTTFLSPKGNDLVFLMEDKERRVRLDWLEMEYYRALITNENLADHLSVPQELRVNVFSCREKSNIIDYDDVGVLASIASREIQRHYQEQDAVVEIWRINKPLGVVSCVHVMIDEWEAYKKNGVTIFVSKALQNTLNQERMKWDNLETGGCLCGCYDKDRRIIYVFHQIDAPEDSIHMPDSFVRGTKGLIEEKNKIAERTYYQVRYLGEWHSHPRGDMYPSLLDKQQFEKLDNELLQQDVPFVQMICSPKGFYVNCRM